jgi:hypothetical protein
VKDRTKMEVKTQHRQRNREFQALHKMSQETEEHPLKDMESDKGFSQPQN